MKNQSQLLAVVDVGPVLTGPPMPRVLLGRKVCCSLEFFFVIATRNFYSACVSPHRSGFGLYLFMVSTDFCFRLHWRVRSSKVIERKEKAANARESFCAWEKVCHLRLTRFEGSLQWWCEETRPESPLSALLASITSPTAAFSFST